MTMMHSGFHRMMRGGSEIDKNAKIEKETVKRVFKFARPYRRPILMYLFILAISSGFEVALPNILLKRVIDDAVVPKRADLLMILAGAYVVVVFLNGVLTILGRWMSSKIGEGLIYDLRVALFNHVQRMPIGFFTRTQTGALISRLNSDVVGAQRAVTETTGSVVSIVFNLAWALSLMLTYSVKLTLIAIGLVPVFLAPTKRMGKTLQRFTREQMQNNAAMSTQMTERFQIGGALLVKLFGRRDEEGHLFSHRAAAVRDTGIKTAVYGRIFMVLFMTVAGIGTGLVYMFGGRDVIEGELTLGTLLVFTALLTRLFMPFTMLSNLRVELIAALVSFERVFEVLDFPSSIQDAPSASDLAEPKGQIEFRNVWFRYPKASEVSIKSLEAEGQFDAADDGRTEWVLRDVSFKVEPGKMFALVGPSGAGKTTTSLLVPRLYDATEGTVLIDGNDVRDLTLESLSRSVGIVTQDAHMFHESMRSNLMYAKPDATEADLIEACKAAQIYDLIDSLPDRFDTTVGERGYRLSGGEKQRLAIARLLLKNPAIMILDEATAHLDSESEQLIQRALAEALSGRTSLVIAHRLSTIVKADQILVIDDGKIVERGTHFDLLRGSGLYGELYRTQFQVAVEHSEEFAAAHVGQEI